LIPLLFGVCFFFSFSECKKKAHISRAPLFVSSFSRFCGGFCFVLHGIR
jgi:hypothetical protein